jgi:hypothetical protein
MPERGIPSVVIKPFVDIELGVVEDRVALPPERLYTKSVVSRGPDDSEEVYSISLAVIVTVELLTANCTASKLGITMFREVVLLLCDVSISIPAALKIEFATGLTVRVSSPEEAPDNPIPNIHLVCEVLKILVGVELESAASPPEILKMKSVASKSPEAPFVLYTFESVVTVMLVLLLVRDTLFIFGGAINSYTLTLPTLFPTAILEPLSLIDTAIPA